MSKRADATEPAFWADSDDDTVALERYRTLVNTVDDGIYQLDAAGRFVAVNNVIVEMTGYSRDELLGDHVSIILEDDDIDRLEQEISESFTNDENPNETFEFLARTANGERINCELRVNLLVEEETFQGTVGIVRDVTDRKRAEEMLDERERQLERERDLIDQILKTSPVGILVLNRDGEIDQMNNRAHELLAVPRGTEEDYDPSDREVFDKDGRPIPAEEHPFAHTLETGEPVYDRILRIELPDGGHRWLSVNAEPILDNDGEVVRVVTTGEDVTELKERSRRLERQTDVLSAELEEIYGRITDGFVALNEEWEFTHVNDRAEEILGSDRSELLGTIMWEAYPDMIDSPFEDRYREAMETQTTTSIEEYYPALDTWFKEFIYPSETGLSVYFRDVTEQKERERELTKYETIVETINDGIYVKDANGRFTMVNDAYAELTGYDRVDLLGEHASLVVDEDTIEQSRKKLTEMADEGTDNPAMEAEISTADGDRVPAEGTFATLQTPDGRREEVGVVRDITTRKARERKLRESERRYRTLAEYFPNGIVTLFDHDLEYTLAAGQGFERIPVEPADLEGHQFHDVWPDETAAELKPAFQAALEGDEASVEVEYAGREWVLHGVPITGERGEVYAGMTMAQDITEQKERERYLADTKAQLEAATEAGAVGTWEWLIPEDQMITGSTFARTFGVDPEAAREGVSSDRFFSSIHEDDRDRVKAKMEAALDTCGEYEAEYRVWNDDNELRWVVSRGRVECDEDGNPVTFPGAVTDITDRKRAELTLQRTKEELHSLIEILPVGVVVADQDGGLIEANNAAREIWGGDVFDVDSIDEYENYPVWWADTGEPVERDEWTLARVLRGEEITEPRVFEIEATDGKRRILSVRGVPIRDEQGEVTRGVITLSDITERREYQHKLEETIEQLEASNERLEHFAYAASHDLQEPLRMVSTYLQLIEKRYGDVLDTEGEEFLEFAIDGADRMREMIGGLLEYSRIETQGDPFEPIELEAIFEDCLEDLQLRLEESDATIAAEELPSVNGDANQLRQLFQNLLSNAIEYSGDEPPRIHLDAEQHGREWVISVRDDGIGIDSEDQEHIFEVFQRLHGRGEHSGTGIGLAICQRIVERHGGEIWVDSEPGVGSTFSFTLAAAANE